MLIMIWIVTLIVAFFIGVKLSPKFVKKNKTVDEETRRKQERDKKAFHELMTYDYDIALGGVRHE